MERKVTARWETPDEEIEVLARVIRYLDHDLPDSPGGQNPIVRFQRIVKLEHRVDDWSDFSYKPEVRKREAKR